MKLSTLNVVEMKNDELFAVHAYFNTPEGAIDAEEKFCELLRIDGANDEEVEEFCADRYFENGYYQVFMKESDMVGEEVAGE